MTTIVTSQTTRTFNARRKSMTSETNISTPSRATVVPESRTGPRFSPESFPCSWKCGRSITLTRSLCPQWRNATKWHRCFAKCGTWSLSSKGCPTDLRGSVYLKWRRFFHIAEWKKFRHRKQKRCWLFVELKEVTSCAEWRHTNIFLVKCTALHWTMNATVVNWRCNIEPNPVKILGKWLNWLNKRGSIQSFKNTVAS